MAKYIDKEKLPQFQFYNHCESDKTGWNLVGDDKYVYYQLFPTAEHRFRPFDNKDHFDSMICDSDYLAVINSKDERVISSYYDKWVNERNKDVTNIKIFY